MSVCKSNVFICIYKYKKDVDSSRNNNYRNHINTCSYILFNCLTPRGSINVYCTVVQWTNTCVCCLCEFVSQIEAVTTEKFMSMTSQGQPDIRAQNCATWQYSKVQGIIWGEPEHSWIVFHLHTYRNTILDEAKKGKTWQSHLCSLMVILHFNVPKWKCLRFLVYIFCQDLERYKDTISLGSYTIVDMCKKEIQWLLQLGLREVVLQIPLRQTNWQFRQYV